MSEESDREEEPLTDGDQVSKDYIESQIPELVMNTQSASDDERVIREVVSTWMQATQEGDTAKVLSLMAEDAVFLVAGKPPFGKAAFAEQSKALEGQRMHIEGVSNIEELVIVGDIAHLRNKLQVTMSSPSMRKPMKRAGYTLTVLRKVSGKWLLARDANLLVEVDDGARAR